MAKAAADRVAIERWEDEGGALAIEEPLSARPGELLDSDVQDGISFGADSHARYPLEPAKRSSS